MLATQEWLINNHGNFELLNKQLGINTTFHEVDNRVILNYCQIDSSKHKTHPIVRECRALTLNKNDFSLIAKSFNRFFNYGEHPETDQAFFWDKCYIQEKLDGSLISAFYWNNDWHIQTRASFGTGNINGINWRELFELAEPNWKGKLRPSRHGRLTYVFELCSRYNKVVRDYPTPTATLLTVFDDECELSHNTTTSLANDLGLKRPQVYNCSSFQDVQNQIEQISSVDKTFEGFVLRDDLDRRIKCKAKNYLLLHRLCNNGNGFLPKNLVPLILQGDEEELVAYWPEQKDKIEQIKSILNKVYIDLDNNWYCFADEVSQKKFALAIAKCPANGILFQARKSGIDWKKIYYKSTDLLIKLVEEKLK